MHCIGVGRECYLARLRMARMNKDGDACNMVWTSGVFVTAHRDPETHESEP